MFSTYLYYLILLTCINAAAIPKVGVFKLDFSSYSLRELNDDAIPEFLKRDVKEATVSNKDNFYITDMYLGSNNQKVSVELDTGSSDLWVIGKDSGIDTSYGTYDSSASSSYKKLNGDLDIGYFDGSHAKGDYVTDSASLSSNGDFTLKDFQFGVATDTSKNIGMFGIGLTALESTDDKYANFPQALKDQGYIKKNAYSLYLSSNDDASGTVLFGGIDHAKYTGDLVKLDINSDKRLNVQLDKMSSNGNTADIGTSVTLDSGATYSYLSSDNLQKLADAVGATKQSDGHFGWSSCDDAPESLTVSFQGIDIEMGRDYLGGTLKTKKGNPMSYCSLKFFVNDNQSTLGNNFLRSVYAVYDLDDKTISLAPAKYTSDEDIQTIS